MRSIGPQRSPELEAEEKGLREALDRQAAGKVQMHEATRELAGHVARGSALMVQLHDLIRGSAAAKEARKAKKKPPEQGPNPAPTAAPETDGTT